MNVEGISLEKIIVLYKQGKSFQYIADFYQIDSIPKMKHRIHEYIKDNNLFNICNDRFKNINVEELYEFRQQGLTNNEIGLLYDLSIQQVEKKILKYCKANSLEPPYSISKRKEIDLEQLRQDFECGMNFKKLQEKYHVSSTVIRSRIHDIFTEEEIDKIVNKKNNGNLKESIDFVRIYETGIKLKDIVNYCNIPREKLESILSKHYDTFLHKFPKIISEKTFNHYNNNNYPIEKLIEDAKNAGKIIPTYLINKVKGFELKESDIKNFIINKTLENKDDVFFTNLIKEDIDFAQKLKDKQYDLKHQITALLYNVANSKQSNISEIINVVGGDIDIIKAILVLNSGKEVDKEVCEIAYNIKQEIKNVKNARLMNNVLLEELNFYKKDDNEQR